MQSTVNNQSGGICGKNVENITQRTDADRQLINCMIYFNPFQVNVIFLNPVKNAIEH